MDIIKQEPKENLINKMGENLHRSIVNKFSQNKARTESSSHKTISHMKKTDTESFTWKHVLIKLFNLK